MPRIQSTPTLRAAQRSSHSYSSYYQSNNKWHTSTIRCLITSSILFILIIWILAILGLDSSNESDGNIIEIEDIPPADTNIQQIIDANNNQLQLHAHENSNSHHGTIPTPRATIAYAVSLTSCGISADRHDNIKNGGHSSDPSFHEGAAVLKHSIHLASVRNYHVSKSLFDYEVRVCLMFCATRWMVCSCTVLICINSKSCSQQNDIVYYAIIQHTTITTYTIGR